MRILHTSDWHIGRTFHGFSTLSFIQEVLAALVALVRAKNVDVVIVAGDVFDSSTPSAEAYEVLTDALLALRQAGATVILTSGNHDSPTRLGFQSRFAAAAGVHVLTGRSALRQPVSVGDVHFYGIPYLEPAIVRTWWPEATTHDRAVAAAVAEVRDDWATRGGRAVVAAHCFALGVSAEGPEKDITAGGLQYVSVDHFADFDYTALGHIHSRHVLTDRVRYSGAIMHYSFSEAGRPRGGWLIDLADGCAGDRAGGQSGELVGDRAGEFVGGRASKAVGDRAVDRLEWVDLPVPRALSVLTGDLADLLDSDKWIGAETDWVAVTLTDPVRPMDAMAQLRQRFPYCARLEFQPNRDDAETHTYAKMVAGKTDIELVDEFLNHVRGIGLSDPERALVTESFAELAKGEVEK